MTSVRLTEKQRQFAEDNHKVLEDFLQYRKLPMEEFYDVIVFWFLRAVQQYDEREDLRQYSFKTIAVNHMRSALGHYFENQKRQRENGVVLSLDYPLAQNSNMMFGDIIADERVNVCEEVCEKLSRTPMKYELLHISQSTGRRFRMFRLSA